MKFCIFCEGTAKTHEHAWPKWLFRSLGTAGKVDVWFGSDEKHRQWRVAPITVKYLCSGCNSGWMSRLENQTRPLIAAMMHDLSIRLNQDQQHLVTAWCIKTAMVFEYTNPNNTHFYTQDEREHLRLRLQIPDDTLLWLGRQHRSDFTYCHSRKLSGAGPKNKPVLSEGYVTTFSAARLVLQVLTIRRNPEHRNWITIDPLPGPWDRGGLLTIWPPTSSISWPPAWSFDEPDLDPFSRRFRNPSP